MKEPQGILGSLLRRRSCWAPTWRGWLVLVGLMFALVFWMATSIHPFLAVVDPLPGGVLVVEGWVPDYALREAILEFQRHPYRRLMTTGGPLERGAPLSEYQTYAELAMATLVKLGLNADSIQAVPAPETRKDRTYLSAVVLRDRLRRQGESAASLNLVTLGSHARRSRLLFQQAFGRETQVGVVAIEDRQYDPRQWWKTSQGVRTVTGEIMAYLYARLFYRPGPE